MSLDVRRIGAGLDAGTYNSISSARGDRSPSVTSQDELQGQSDSVELSKLAKAGDSQDLGQQKINAMTEVLRSLFESQNPLTPKPLPQNDQERKVPSTQINPIPNNGNNRQNPGGGGFWR